MYAQLAKVALDVMAEASIQATDKNLQAVLAARAMLSDIMAGKLAVVSVAPQGA